MDFGFYGMRIRPPVQKLWQFEESLLGSQTVAGSFSADEKLKKNLIFDQIQNLMLG